MSTIELFQLYRYNIFTFTIKNCLKKGDIMIDGIVLNNIATDLENQLIGGRIDKIAQPEKDELVITIRANSNRHHLLLSTHPTMPRIHLTQSKKKNPPAAPPFCMLLRKYIGNGRIMDIQQHQLERILIITLEQLNEMGDLCSYRLIIEIMGKHSNIILIDQENIVLDSMKRINLNISRVRQIYPGLSYTFPPDQAKTDIRLVDSVECLRRLLNNHNAPVADCIYKQFMGISPFIANQLCLKSQLHPTDPIKALQVTDYQMLYPQVQDLISQIKNRAYQPYSITDSTGELIDFHCLKIAPLAADYIIQDYSCIGELIDFFYTEKSIQVRMKQKTVDLRKIIHNALERAYKKYDLQQKQLEDTKNMEKYKIKGELILANIHSIQNNLKKIEVFNYYTNQPLVITLDPNKSPVENANKAFDTYNKKKRTKVAVTEQLALTKDNIEHLESVKYNVENVKSEEEIEDIRSELMATGYLRFRRNQKQKTSKTKPYHYLSSDGYHIYVGKNNLQNDELSMKFAKNSDWWFHTKEIPGSHVIVQTNGTDLPDRVYEEAAALAAYYSKGRQNKKVVVDYTLKKHLKKPNGSVPGYVIYHTNYSLTTAPSIAGLSLIE